jgi:plasmid segregation protein ParM
MSNFEFSVIPSVFESAPLNLDRTSNKLITSLKIKHDDDFFIVGDLALTEGVSPHKEINCSPTGRDYNIFLKSALLVSNTRLGNPLTITTGFPFATYRMNRDLAQKLIVKEHVIEYDSSLYSSGSIRKTVVEVSSGAIMPEVSSCALAVRKTRNVNSDFMMISLGYGTFETVFSTAEGENGVQRTSNSAPGMIYAIELLKKALAQEFYSGMPEDYYFDQALQAGYIFLNRKKYDLKDMRKKVLNQYYDNIISPNLKKNFTDKEFSKSSGLYLSGGGALYPEIIERFKNEFDGVIDVIIPENPNMLAATGYCINSAKLSAGDTSRAVGIDLGNSSTIICYHQQLSN